MRFQSVTLAIFMFLLTVLSVVQFHKTKGLRTMASFSVGDEVAVEGDESFAVIGHSDTFYGVGVQLQRASLALGQKQPFMAAVREVFQPNGPENNFFETNQILSPEFRRAISPQTQQNLCGDFIDENGNYGDLGRMIVHGLTIFPELSNLIDDAAANKAGMKNICPRFINMTPDQRKDFWVWTMVTVALFESTCGYDTQNESNRHAVGMFQLHESVADREPRALLNGRICGRLTREQIAPAANNTACALDFMRDSFSGRMDHAPAGLITDAQQFERLRNGDSTIIRVLKKFRLCQNPGTI